MNRAHLLLALSEREELDAAGAEAVPVRQFHQVPSRVSSRREDKHHRRSWSRLLQDCLESDDTHTFIEVQDN